MPSKKTKTGSLSEWSIVADRFKTRICRSWDESGECEYMARCMFAHGPQELRTAEQNVAAGLVNPTAVRAYQRHQAKVAKARRLSSSEGSMIEASSASSSNVDACLPTPPPSSCLVNAPLPHEPSHYEHELSYMQHHEAQMHASSPAFAGHHHPSYSHGGCRAPPPGYHQYSSGEERLRSLAYPHNHAPSPHSPPPPHQRSLLQHGHPHHEHNHPHQQQQQQQPHHQHHEQQRQDSATCYNTEGMYPSDERCPADHFCTGPALPPPPPLPTRATSTPPTPPYTRNAYSDFAAAPTVANTAPPPGYNALHPSNSMPPMPPFNNHHARKVNTSAIADPHRQYGLQGGLVHPKGHPHGRAPDGSMCRCLECVQAHFAAKVVSDDRHEAAVDSSAEESPAKKSARRMKARRNGHQPHVLTA